MILLGVDLFAVGHRRGVRRTGVGADWVEQI